MTQDFGDIGEVVEQLTELAGGTDSDPPVDVVETDEKLVVDVDLPGRHSDEIDVAVRDGRELTVEVGARTDEREGRYVVRERAGGAVSRSIRLPERVEESETEAGYDRGVLTISLPKSEAEPDGTSIPVE